MGINKDIEEAVALWRNASWPMRGLVVLSAILATSSVTSIADVVFKWKGFVLQGVNFYREWIRGPIVELLSFINIPNWASDLLIILSIYLFVLFKSDRGLGGWGLLKQLIISVAVVCGMILITTLLTIAFPDQRPFILLLALVGGNGLLIDVCSDDRRKYYLVFASVLFLVCVLGAINVGLNKS